MTRKKPTARMLDLGFTPRQETGTAEQRDKDHGEAIMLNLVGPDALGARIINALIRTGIDTPAKLLATTDEELVGIRTIGARCCLRLGRVLANLERDRENERI